MIAKKSPHAAPADGLLTTAIVAVSVKGRPGPSGIALGLLISAAVLLAFDIVAERRGGDCLTVIGSGECSG